MLQVSDLLDETRPNSIVAIDGFLLEQCATEVTQFCEKDKLYVTFFVPT